MPENPASYRVVRTKSYLFNKANLDTNERNDLVDEIEAGHSLEEALELLEVHMGFSTTEMTEIVRRTPIGDIHILRDKLSHIV
ncbi:hypothetical protein ACTHI9_27610, partial [Citrobacter freundii]